MFDKTEVLLWLDKLLVAVWLSIIVGSFLQSIDSLVCMGRAEVVAWLLWLPAALAGCGIYQNGTMKMPLGFKHSGPLLKVRFGCVHLQKDCLK